MKKFTICLSAVFAATLFSCNDTDDHANAALPDASLQGQWKLVKVEGSITGMSNSFTPGLITWDFNTTANTVTVTNNNTDASKEDVLDSGNYTFGLNNPDEICTEALLVNAINYGCLDINGSQMVVDQSFADGIKLTFVK